MDYDFLNQPTYHTLTAAELWEKYQNYKAREQKQSQDEKR